VGAASDSDARVVAKSVAGSSLAKAALFGHDPNWGRIAAAAGYSGVQRSMWHSYLVAIPQLPLSYLAATTCHIATTWLPHSYLAATTTLQLPHGYRIATA
jgi:ArgJ family